MNCAHSKYCKLCPLMTKENYGDQSFNKLSILEFSLHNKLNYKSIMFHDFQDLHHRNRVDLTYQNNILGYLSEPNFSIFELNECPQMSDELFEAYQKIKQIKFNVKKGSLRLRANILNDQRKLTGLWLDFSNLDTKVLLDSKETLISVLQNFTHVEIGQRRKSLQLINEKLKLNPPTLHCWTKTYYLGHVVDIYSTVGGFTQSGNKAQLILSEIVNRQLNVLNSTNIFEFGSGIGTLTLGMIKKDRKIVAAENDLLALLALKKNLELYDKHSQVQIINQDLYRINHFKELNEQFNFDTIVVNPPRSGLMSFVNLVDQTNVKNLIYVSCSIESFKKDFDQLFQFGFIPTHAEIVDQFAYSKHFESVVTLTKQ